MHDKIIRLEEDVGKVYTIKKELVYFFNHNFKTGLKASVSQNKREIRVSGKVSDEQLVDFLDKKNVSYEIRPYRESAAPEPANTSELELLVVDLQNNLESTRSELDAARRQSTTLGEENTYFAEQWDAINKDNKQLQETIKRLETARQETARQESQEYDSVHDAILAYLKGFASTIGMIDSYAEAAFCSHQTINDIVEKLQQLGLPVKSRHELERFKTRVAQDSTLYLARHFDQNHTAEVQEYRRTKQEIATLQQQIQTTMSLPLPEDAVKGMVESLEKTIQQRTELARSHEDKRDQYIQTITVLLKDCAQLEIIDDAKQQLLQATAGGLKLPLYIVEGETTRIFIPSAKHSKIYDMFMKRFEEKTGELCFYETKARDVVSNIKKSFYETELPQYKMHLEFTHTYAGKRSKTLEQKVEQPKVSIKDALIAVVQQFAGKTRKMSDISSKIKKIAGGEVSIWTLRRHMKDLEEEGKVEQIGSKRGTRYKFRDL